MKDPYKTLGVGRSADAAEIKRAYRKLAKKLHPDVNPGNVKVEQQFKEVSQAHGILGDAKKRAQFDRGEIDAGGQQTGWGGFGGGRARRGGTWSSAGGPARGAAGGARHRPFDFGADLNVEDIVSELFGARGRARKARQRGADVSYTAPIGFLDAAVGTKKRIRLSDGKVLDMKVPAGTEDRQTLRLKGQGMAGERGGAAGDAFVEVHIEPHAYFTRKDVDVHLELPVTLREAVLGATVQVPTVHGKVSMKIPPNSNTGATLRLKGKGIANRKGGGKGDQYVMLKVTLPDKPDKPLKDFIEDWTPDHDYNPRRKAGMD
jgi:DnaJ-class molecular chaperone